MNKQLGRVLFAVFLIGVGVVTLLSNLNLLPFQIHNEQAFWLVVFSVIGVAFLATFFSGMQENWWAIIPALTLLALAMLIGLPAFWGTAGGAMFLGMIGLSFFIVFITARHERWWAIIPGGVLLTLATVTLISDTSGDGMASGGVFFLGLALTFLVVYLVMRMQWALWPAGILGLMGSLLMLGAGNMASLVFPALLIGVGGLLIFRAMRPKM